MKKTKNNKKILEAIDATKVYEAIDAIKILKDNKYAKFNETLEVAINLGIDSNKTDQNIKGVINLPKGTGKKMLFQMSFYRLLHCLSMTKFDLVLKIL